MMLRLLSIGIYLVQNMIQSKQAEIRGLEEQIEELEDSLRVCHPSA